MKIKKQSVILRFQVLSTAFIVVLVAVLIYAATTVLDNISTSISDDYAYFYSVEAVEKLNSYLNREIGLVGRTARSKALIEWFSDEQNTDKRLAAIDEMIPYGNMLFSEELYFVIDKSLNEYSIYISEYSSPADFEPFDKISPEVEYDIWYYRCIESANDYTLNIDVDKITGERRLWINHKVEKDGEILGVFCSGLNFSEVINNLFRMHNIEEVRSVIIDEYGVIQMDNTRMSEEAILQEGQEHIGTLSSDEVFLDTVKNYRAYSGKHFTLDDIPQVIKPQTGDYCHISFAPVANTSWIVVTFFNSSSLFNEVEIYPLIIIAVTALLLYSVYIILLSRRLLIQPFGKLLDSLSHAWDENSDLIYGYGLQNEFGEIYNTLQYTQLLFNATPLSCFLWDSNKKLINCNDEALRLFGMKSKAELGERFYELSPEYQPDGCRSGEVINSYLDKVLSEGYAQMEVIHQTLGGEIIPCEVISIRLRHINEYVIASYLRDLREQKAHQAEIESIQESLRRERDAAEAANHAKSSFLASMSHEIRVPMNAILGAAEIELQKESLPPDTEESLSMIYESGHLLLSIVNDILDLSKIEAGKLEIVPVNYSIPGLLNDAVQINRLYYGNRQIDFILNIDENVPLNLLGDELRIKQILNNLLSNAFKYTEKGHVSLTITAAGTGGSDTTITFKVSDTGRGMTEEQLDLLFNEYTRFDLDLNKNTEGTGLGLSITKQLLKLMNGEITVESKPGKGSAFTVHIPQKRTDQLVCGASLSDKIWDYHYKSKHIADKNKIVREYMPYGSVLVVDDVESNIYVAKGMLLPYGLQIDSAGSGYEVAEKIKIGKTYDIIFMDHMMPGMDGIETAQKIRKMGYKHAIIALTANALLGQAETFLAKGFDGYLSKPVDSRELNEILNEFIRDKKPPDIVKAARQEQQQDKLTGRDNFVEYPENMNLNELFIMDAEGAIETLEGLLGNAGALSDTNSEDNNTYEITVHGIKSALANIGETELSSTAYKLEKAAVAGDIGIITGETPSFIEALKAVIEKMSKSK